MDNEKQRDILEFLPWRPRELLRRLAALDHRSEIKELIWMIERFASGKLHDLGDGAAIRRVSFEDLPDPARFVEKASANRVRVEDLNKELAQPKGSADA